MGCLNYQNRVFTLLTMNSEYSKTRIVIKMKARSIVREALYDLLPYLLDKHGTFLYKVFFKNDS